MLGRLQAGKSFSGSELPPSVRIRPTAQWGGQTGFRRQVAYVIKQRLEPSLKAAGSALEHCLKAQAYIRGVENFPDFMDVWSQHFHEVGEILDEIGRAHV